jgi:hypothetical protein
VLPGGAYSAGRVHSGLEEALTFLVSRALVSDRPSFVRGGNHIILLEAEGMAFTARLLESCPSLAWYAAQGEVVAAFGAALERIDLLTMPYLAPELDAARAAVVPLTPVVRGRLQRLFT